MKITYIKLENFIGIYAGTGKKSIEIDFTKKNKNKIIMLLGKNGSGKTTLMSALSPMRGTNDDRADFIIEGENGYKEIHINNNKDKYVIKHFYGKNSSKNKSFITKNGEELNENGNVRSFNATLFEELGVDDDFFKVGRLGSNVTNFIDLKTAERKKYINKFIPSIDDYLEAFEKVKTKFSDASRDMKVLTNQLEKFEDLETIRNNLKSLEEKINEVESYIENDKKIATLKENRLNELNDLISKKLEINPNDAKIFISTTNSKLSTLQKAISEINDSLDELFEKYSALSDYDINRCDEVLNECNNIISVKEVQVKSNTEMIEDYKKRKASLENKISLLTTKIENDVTEDPIALKESVEKTEKELEMFKKFIDETEIDKEFLVIIDDYKTMINIKNSIYRIITDINENIKSEYSQDVIEYVFDNGHKSIKELIENLNSDKSLIENDIKDINKQIASIEGKSNLLDILKNRSPNCNDPKCSFISNALDYKENEYIKLDDLYSRLEELNKKLKEVESELDKNILYYNISNKINDFIENRIKVNDLIEKVITIKGFSIKDLFLCNSTILTNDLNLNTEVTYFNYLSNIDIMSKELENSKFRMDKVQEILKNYDSMIEDRRKLIDELNDINNSLVEKDNEVNNCNKTIKAQKTKIEILNKLKDTLNNKNELSKEEEELKSKLLAIKDYIKDIEETTYDLSEVNGRISSFVNNRQLLTEKLNNTKRQLYLVEDTTNKIKNIEENYDILKIIKESLDPKCGIPLVFIDNYLKDIAQRANELLNIAYNGQFMINFEISSSDFFIKVLKSDGTTLKDISDASQGETSLTNISLSLAMIEKMIKKYNIIYLDEIDCTLSTENRRMFIELLENQIEKLNIEQVFIISHNNEFHTYPVDLILLKDNDADIHNKEFMESKNIIYDLYNKK